MRNKMKNKISKSIGTLMIGILSSACVEFTEAPCNSGELIDVRGYSEARWMNIFDSENSVIYPIEDSERQHMGTGLYGNGEEVFTRTCKLGQRIFAESKNDHGGFELVALTSASGKIIASPVMASASTLNELNIPYHFEYRNLSTSHSALANRLGLLNILSNNARSKILVVKSVPPASANALGQALREGPFVVQSLNQP